MPLIELDDEEITLAQECVRSAMDDADNFDDDAKLSKLTQLDMALGNPHNDRPPIDLSRFNVGPLTEEQFEMYETSQDLILINIGKKWFVCQIEMGMFVDGSIFIRNDSRIKLWYPLPEMK